MSTTIDDKVVSMRFDNKQFESNVKTSIGTLDKLKQSLNLEGASKGLENVNNAARRFDASPLSNGIETVRAKFSALEVMAVTALADITNSAVNAGKRLAASFTIDPIKTGFQEYETQINAVQTILANTQSKGTTIKDVNAALDELNAYADKTIYNFTEMTRNIGTFTAAGVGLKESTSAIQGIANLAAVSGSTSQQASTAMYQLSQALSAGTVKLQDWNSVVNAGMGGQVFQDALKKTARAHGVAVDEMIKKNGSFRESLQEGWITSEILTETLSKMTKSGASEYLSGLTGITQSQIEATQEAVAANKDGSKTYDELAEQMAKTGKITKEDALEILKMADTAEDAATKVKTFSQLLDTLKEAAQSGWTQTWEILIGDFEEAKSLLTDVSDYFSEVIGKSAESRNNMLQEWKDAGGREMAIEAIKNAFKGLVSVITPIKEAFREIFPKTTSDQLLKITKAIRDFTAKLIISEKTASAIKSTFKGLFAGIDIVLTLITKVIGGIVKLSKNLIGLFKGILKITGSLGDWISGVRDSIKETDLFGRAVDGVVGFLQKGIDKIKEFFSYIKGKVNAPGFEGFFGLMQRIWEIIKNIGKTIGKVASKIGNALKESFRAGDFASGMDLLNSGILAAILLGVKKFTKNLSGSLEGVKGILDSVRGCFEAFQQNLQAKTLLKIASAIAILTASIVVLSLVDPEKLGNALSAITILFVELIGAMTAFTKLCQNSKGTIKSSTAMIAMSISILILASALKKISDLSWEGIAKGLTGIAGLAVIVTAVALIMSKNSKKMMKGATNIVIFAAALKILASVCKDMSKLSWKEMIKGLVGVGVLMAEVSIFMNTTKIGAKALSTATGVVIIASALKILASVCSDFGNMKASEITKGLIAIGGILTALAIFVNVSGKAKHVVSTGLALVLIGASMKIFASAVKDFATMSFGEIAKGLIAMAGALAAVAITVRLMPKNMLAIGTGLVVVSAALVILSKAMKKMGSMSWSEIGKGLAVLGGSILILAIGLNAMKRTIGGSAALLVAVTALGLFTPILYAFEHISWKAITKGLVAMAGAFSIIGIAGMILKPVIPAILGLSVALALTGAGLVLVGTGLTALAVGFTAIAASATAIVASISAIILGILDMIPAIIDRIGNTILLLIDVIVECIPAIADGFLKLIVGVMEALVEYTPKLIDLLCDFIVKVLDGLTKNIPKLIPAVFNFVGSLFNSIKEALKDVPIDTIMKGVLGFGAMALLMKAIAGATKSLPGAITGVASIGVIIGEISLVLAAIGALAQIPGLDWLINEGGDLLASIGTAIGKFIGGIAGGIAAGFSSSLPQVATDLSNFMTNLQPFIDGAKQLDAGTFEGVKSLASTLLVLTAANLLEQITSWITGGSSLEKFASQLVPFGEAMAEFSSIVSGNIDETAVEAASNAGKMMTEMADTIPNSGGVVGFFVGENDMDDFAAQLVPFGEAIAEFSSIVTGNIDEEAVKAAANAGSIMAEMASTIPNTGGVVSFFAGDNDLETFGDQLVPFGEAITEFSSIVSGNIDETAVEAAANAGSLMVEMANTIPNTGGVVSFFAGDNDLETFGNQLVPFGKAMVDFSAIVSGNIDETAVSAAANAGKTMAEMQSTLPNSGGVVSFFKGDNNMDDFADQLVPFGKAMVDFSAIVAGKVDEKAVSSAANAGKTLAEMQSTLPNTGGVMEFFTGEKDMAKFGEQLVPFGRAMVDFSNSVSGNIDEKAITAASNAGKTLAEMADTIPNSGGLVDFFAGRNDMEEFGEQLVPFGYAMKKFSDAVSSGDGIDCDRITAAAEAGKTLADMADSIPNSGGLFGFFKGDNNLADFGADLEIFGESMKNFSSKVGGDSGIDCERVKAAANAGKLLAQMADAIPNSGGLFSFFKGDNNIADFGNDLVPFGAAMKKFSDAVSEGGGIDVARIEAAANAGKTLAEMAANGQVMASFFSGDMSAFANQLGHFGRGIRLFAAEVTCIGDTSKIDYAIDAGKNIADMASKIPTSGGLFTAITGQTNMTVFSENLVGLGKAITAFSLEVNSIDPSVVTNAATAGTALAEMARTIPNTGGLFGYLAGEKDYSNFSAQIVPIGRGIKDFANVVTGIDTNVVSEAATVGSALIELTKTIPGTGGLTSFLTGDKNISAFSTQLVYLGIGIKNFANVVSGMDATVVTNATTAGTALIELAKTVPSSGGLFSYITGFGDLSFFGTQIVELGKGIKNFANVVSGMDTQVVSNASSAGKALIEMAKTVPGSGGLFSFINGTSDLSLFSSQIVILGKGIKNFSLTVSDINTTSVINASKAGTNIIDLTKKVPKFVNLNKFSEQIIPFGNAITSFSKIISGLNVSKLSENASKIKEAVKALDEAGKKGVKGFIKAFTSSEANVKSSVNKMFTAVITSAKDKGPVFTLTGKVLAEKLIKGFDNKKSDAKKSIKSILDSMISSIEDKEPSFSDAGKNLVSGFADGIDEQTWEAEAKATAMALAALEAAKEALGINSPSKELYEVGIFSGMGLVNALNDYASKVYDAGYDIGDTAKTGISKAISKVTSIIEGGIDSNPTIRPVLDLSDITSGVGTIGNLLDINPSIGVMSNLRSINTMMNRRIQNGDNSDVISAIKDLKKTIGSSSVNTYNINGVTYDDGSNISNAVETIVRAARIERRM